MDDLRILGISGSLRARSLNTALLRATAKHAPAGIRITEYEGLADVPPYNGDLDDEAVLPTTRRYCRRRCVTFVPASRQRTAC
ncbi:hypothetical protein LWC34_02010 [Kibdelosporangium philippinense]|uniref:NADPH-dependent FMN reductase-like domain-containing protein n=1 Tax=Kibdelosporangium philippinense TaxID=211113 RepID=A0ABS8Z0Y3_9PSEU|nr:NAD(P)H-dependent oxidoreductase [Kibdelosporangium philippinense]MCE7001621.1 hypothetical protein [Kibdelosporangium philippinense]